MGMMFEKQETALADGGQDIHIGCSWNPAPKGRVPYDVDCHAFGLMYRDGSVACARPYRRQFGTYPHVLTYANDDLRRDAPGNPHSFCTADESMVHYGDSRHGVGEGHDEEMLIRLHLLPERIDEVAIWITLNAAPRRRETFVHVSANVRVTNRMSNQELCYLPCKEKFPTARAVHVCSFVREGPAWKYVPVSIGVPVDLKTIFESYRRLEDDDLPEFAGCNDVRTRTIMQFASSDDDHGDFASSAVTLEQLAAFVDPLASDDVVRDALSIVTSLSVTDPDSRFAIFGSDLQREYSDLLQKMLKLNKDRRFQQAGDAQSQLLDLIASIDFEALALPPKKVLFWHWEYWKQGPVKAVTRHQFDETQRKVREKYDQLDRHLRALQALRDKAVGLEEQRHSLLNRMRAHMIAASYLLSQLEEGKKANLESRIQSLTITVQTGGNELQGQLQLTMIDQMMHAIRDIMLTWVPVWLSTAKGVFDLLAFEAHADLQQLSKSDAYSRALEARSRILGSDSCESDTTD